MNGVLISTAETHSEEWYAVRRKGIGGSDMPVLFGLSSYTSPVMLFDEKMGLVEPEEAGEAAYWGTVFEPLLIAEFQKRTGLTADKGLGTLQHPIYSWALYNPDAFVTGGFGEELLEVKTCAAWIGDQWAKDDVPLQHQIQVQHGLFVTGLSSAHIVCLIGGQEFITRHIERDETIIAKIIEAGEDFMERLAKNDPPPVDSSEITAKYLGKRYVPEAEKVAELSTDVIGLLADRKFHAEQIKTNEEAKRLIDSTIKQQLAEATIGVVGDQELVSWKPRKDGVRVLNVKDVA